MKHAHCTIIDFKVGLLKGCDTNEHQLSEKHSTAEIASDLDYDNLIEC